MKWWYCEEIPPGWKMRSREALKEGV